MLCTKKYCISVDYGLTFIMNPPIVCYEWWSFLAVCDFNERAQNTALHSCHICSRKMRKRKLNNRQARYRQANKLNASEPFSTVKSAEILRIFFSGKLFLLFFTKYWAFRKFPLKTRCLMYVALTTYVLSCIYLLVSSRDSLVQALEEHFLHYVSYRLNLIPA